MNSVTAVMKKMCLANLTLVARVAVISQKATVSFCLGKPAGLFSISNAFVFLKETTVDSCHFQGLGPFVYTQILTK